MNHEPNPRTGFIHFHYSDETAFDTIPLYENGCFILSLFRSRIAENALKARELLRRLLHFQTEEGGFPTYLHEYPTDRWAVSFNMLLPLFWIDKLYGKFIDKEQLSQAIKRLMKYCENKSAAPYLRYKLDVVQNKYTMPQVDCPDQWGHLLFASELISDSSLRQKLLQKALQKWNHELFLYENCLQSYRKNSPETTLLDVYLSQLYQITPSRLKYPHPKLLQASLCFSKAKQPEHTHSAVSKYLNESMNNHLPPTWHLLRYTWGNKDELHSLCCQEKSFTFEEDVFTYPEKGELILYFSARIKWLIEGEKATIFKLGDRITLEAGGRSFTISFSLEEGEGVFLGQIYKANRPAQLTHDPFVACDWAIHIKTIERTDHIRMGFEFYDNAGSCVAESAGLSTATPIA